LMPPLCVTGFGLANGNLTIIINSFYLFFLNATLVAFATFAIVRFLRFPMKQYGTAREKRNMHFIIYGVSLLIIIPSILILKKVWADFNLKRDTKEFLSDYCGENIKYVDSWDIIKQDSFNQIAIKIYGSGYKHFDKQKMEEGLENLNIKNTKIDLIPTTEVDLAKLQKLEADLSGFKSIAQQLEIAKETKSENEVIIGNLQAKIDSIQADTIPFDKICVELKAAFPNIDQVAFAEAKESNFERTNELPILLLRWKKSIPLSNIRREEPRIQNFIQARIELDTLKIVRY